MLATKGGTKSREMTNGKKNFLYVVLVVEENTNNGGGDILQLRK